MDPIFECYEDSGETIYREYCPSFVTELFKAKTKKEILETPSYVTPRKGNFLKVLPTFLNVIKGRVFYNLKTKRELKALKNPPKDIILGTFIDATKIEEILGKEGLTKKDINDFCFQFDVMPLFFKQKDNIIYKNRKETFFRKETKLLFLTFKVKNNTHIYYEALDEPPTELREIADLKPNFIVAHYLYDNYYFLVTQPQHKLTLDKIYTITPKLEIEPLKNEMSTLQKRINLSEMQNLALQATEYLTELNI
ncbi:putative ssDNA/dsDNA binding protein [Diachasmimorpha longicaudata entomopoxvirus]|uniref:Putative ssDNA/dsDNA binding protein n=1 Tax=Diachasmimorpha longicaudata entomopoxvirus TaxID=109981 RepID=A0A7R5WU32_9POXV|nr:putative ssDNA/dsDNA binding protein [Diachasmimorpha longicaudata entomopoxvirus]AKS26327.1 putative ssDNA/dsDNA binding protein [Diachasmimorpha longicaudata entomopoxvirus]